MSWELQFLPRAHKQLSKLDRQVAQRILKELEKLTTFDNPEKHCKALTGNYTGYWRYRAGDYRVIVDFDRGRLVIMALEISHRSQVYKK